jgi:hypothetical protein
MENNENQIARLEQKIDAVHASVEKSRKYIVVMLIATLAMFLLPLIMAVAVLPFLMSTIESVYSI